MARDEAMHMLLLHWGQALTMGDGSGYPTLSTLHPDWSPPSPGTTPTLKVSHLSADVRRVHAVVQLMSRTLAETLVLVYGFPTLGLAEHARRLGKSESTVRQRVESAQHALRVALGERRAQYAHMRELR